MQDVNNRENWQLGVEGGVSKGVYGSWLYLLLIFR